MAMLVSPHRYDSQVPDLPPSYNASTLLALPSGFSYSRGSSATYRAANGKLTLAGSGAARFEYKGANPIGLKMEQYAENYQTNNNYNPTTTTGVTVGGGGTSAATISVMPDPGYMTTAVNEYGDTVDLTGLCTSQKLYSVNNSAGNATAYVEIAGSPTDTVNFYTMSAYALCNIAGAVISYGDPTTTALATTAIPVTARLARYSVPNIIPDVTTKFMRITIPAGATLYFILNQFEQNPFATSIVPIAGATASRQADTLVDNSISGRSYYNAAAGAIQLECDVDNIDTQPQSHFLMLCDGTSSSTALKNNMSVHMVQGRSRVKTLTAINNVKVPLTYMANHGQSGTDIGSVDKAGAVFHAGFSWTAGTSSAAGNFVAITSALNSFQHSLSGPFNNAGTTTTLNHLYIFSRPFADVMCGHVKSIKIWNSQPTLTQMGKYMNFAGAYGEMWIGQSNLAYEAGADAGNSGALNGYNDGERACIAAMDVNIPQSNRNYCIQGASGGASYLYSQAGSNYFYDLGTGQYQYLFNRAVDMANGFLAGGGHIPYIKDNQGETDITTSQATLQLGRVMVCGGLRNAINLPNIPILHEPIGRREDSTGAGSDGGYQNFRDSLHVSAMAGLLANYYEAPERFIEPMGGDAVHTTDLGYKAYGPMSTRKGISVAGISTPLTGPVDGSIFSAASLSGNVVTLTLSHPNGITDFTPTSGITGFRFFDRATLPTPGSTATNEITISSAVRVNATTIAVTLASTPTTTGLIYYGYGAMYKTTAVDYTMLLRCNDALQLSPRSAAMLLPYVASTQYYSDNGGTLPYYSDDAMTQPYQSAG